MNSKMDQWAINFFLQAAYHHQQLVDVEYVSGAVHSTDFVIVTPGIILPISDMNRFLFGVQYTADLRIEDATEAVPLRLRVQFETTF